MLQESHILPQNITSKAKSGNMVKKTLFFFAFLGMMLILGLSLLRDFPGLVRQLFTGTGTIISNTSPIKIDTNDNVWVLIGQVNQTRVLTDLRRLTGVEPICLNNNCNTITNRITGSDGLKLAENYVIDQLTSMGYIVQIQNWSKNGYSDNNLLVRKPGKVFPGEEIYFVAHLDGENCPAADDNASGVVSLLELARIISHLDFNRTLVLLFSTGEEQSTSGVESYIDQLTPQQLAAIQFVVNVDMIGYDKNMDGRMELFNGTQPLDFVQLLSGIITDYQLNLQPEIYSDCG
jgi:hypothetical protein